MQDKIQNMIREFERTRKIRRRAYAALTAMAIVVSLGTGYALMQPAQTMSNDTICGLEEHIHGESCYETVLVCTDENREGHAHSEECYPMEYICGQEVVEAHSHGEECNSITCGLEQTAGHAHDETCTGIACGLEATEGHNHSDSCYGVACGKAETEGHSHGDGCYEQQSRLTCTAKEGEGHSHSDSCYGNTCGKSESDGHSHDDGCYSEASELTCSLSESGGHGHGDDCYGEDGSLTCSESESEGHSHGDGCYTTKRELTCGQSECEAHSHDAYCEGLTCGQNEYEAHAHGEGCYVQENVLVCKEAEVAPHAHDESCDGLICTVEECAPHAHDETCNGLTCGQEEHDAHIHEDACSTLTCEIEETEGHAHTAECEGGRSETPDCGKEECEPYITDHIHGETCYETRLVCELPEHIHEDACYEAEPEAFCGFEEHAHGDECYGEPVLVCEDTTEGHEHNEDCSTIELICELPEHVHIDECFVEPVEVMVILPEGAEIPEGYDDVRTFTSEDETFSVAVYAPMGAIPEDATLVAEILMEDSEEYVAAAESLDSMLIQQEEEPAEEPIEEPAEETEKPYDGMIAMDIRFEDADGNEVEPYEPVYVVINALGLLPENADPESVSIQHHAEIQPVSTFSLRTLFMAPAEPEIVVTTVADAAEDTGVVELVENEDFEAQDVLTAFPVESFSKFTVSWNDKSSYVITCIDAAGFPLTAAASSYTYTGNDVITLDDVSPNIEGYSYLRAVVAASAAEAIANATEIKQFVRSNNTWQCRSDTSGEWTSLGGNNKVYFIYELRGETFRGVTPPGTTVNLFNYSKDGSPNINTGHTLNFNDGGEKDTIGWNKWTDHGGSHPHQAGVYQGIVKPNLESNRDPEKGNYPVPVLAVGNGESLDYLFDPIVEHATKETYKQVDYLFQLDENGYYRYDADKNFAQLVDGNFILHSTPVTHNQKFAPFNKNRDKGDLNSYGHFGMHVQTEFTMAKDGKVNGKDMVFEFSGDDDVWVFVDGMLILDMGGIHSKFSGSINFATGKVWIDYVLEEEDKDDKEKVGSAQDNITLYDMMKAAGKSDEWFAKNMVNIGTPEAPNYIFKDYSSHTFDFFYMERGLGSSNCRIIFNLPTIPKNSLVVGKELEAGDSNVTDGMKTFVAGALDYTFEVLKVDANGEIILDENGEPVSMFDLSDPDNLPTYQIMENSVIVGGGKVKEDGTFTLKAGQSAVFDGLLDPRAGFYVVRERMPNNINGQYLGARYEVVSAGGNSTSTFEKGSSTDDFVQYTSGRLNAADNTTTVMYHNVVNLEALSTLRVTKVICPGSEIDDLFRIKILIDNEPLAVGTSYVITDAKGNTTSDTIKTEDGIIEIKRDETITLGVLQGSKVTVYEETEGKYTVDYKGTITGGGTTTNMTKDTSGSGIGGTVVNTGSDIQVTVYNSAASVDISKTLKNAGVDEEKTFIFNIDKLDEKDPAKTSYPEQITITTKGSAPESKAIYFVFDEDAEIGEYIYRIYEVIPEDKGGIDYDKSSYIVKVTVDVQEETGAKFAYVSSIIKCANQEDTTGEAMEPGAPLAFVNSKASLSLEKQVKKPGTNSSSNAGIFTFDLKIDGENGTYDVYDSEDQPIGKITFTDGEITAITGMNRTVDGKTVVVRGGQTITIKGLPVGKTVVITETNTDGYTVSWSGDVNTANGPEVTTVPLTGEKVVAVTCTNTTGPELPSTGGIGTTLYTVLGGLMMACAAGLLELQRRRRSIVD